MWVSLSPCDFIPPTALQTSSWRWTNALRAWCCLWDSSSNTSKAESYVCPSSLIAYEDNGKIFKSISWLNLSTFHYGPRTYAHNWLCLLWDCVCSTLSPSTQALSQSALNTWPTQNKDTFTLFLSNCYKLLTVLQHTSGFYKLGSWTNLQFLNIVTQNIRWPSELKGRRLLKHFI